MDFINPLFLVGLAGVALPVLIHILTRDRIKRVAFSTLRFFAGASATMLRRRRFEEMLLLAMRMTACGLLAVAFARPFFKEHESPAALTQARVARVIVADVSASISRPGLAKALTSEAEKALGGLSEGVDAAALVTFADQPVTDVRLTKTFAEIREKLGTLRPSQGGTDIAAALKAADAILRQAAATTKEIVLISDFQKIGWRSFGGDWKLSPTVHLVTRPIEPAEKSSNVAIVMADCPSGLVLDRIPRAVTARVANFSTTDLAGVEVSLSIGGKQVDARKVNVPAGGKADVRFRHVFDRVGDNLGMVSVAADDPDRSDNVFYFNAHVTPQIAVVVINGHTDANAQQDAATFLRLALMPGSPFAARVIAADAVKPEDAAGGPSCAAGGRRPAAARGAAGACRAPGARRRRAFRAWRPRQCRGFQPRLRRNRSLPAPPESHAHGPCRPRARDIVGESRRGSSGLRRLRRAAPRRPFAAAFPTLLGAELPRSWRRPEHSRLSAVRRRRAPGNPGAADRPAAFRCSMAGPLEPRLERSSFAIHLSPPCCTKASCSTLPMRTQQAHRFHDRRQRDQPTRRTQHERTPSGKAVLSGETITPCRASRASIRNSTQSGAKDRVLAVNRPLTEADPTPIAPERIQAAVGDGHGPGRCRAGRRVGSDGDTGAQARSVFLVVHSAGNQRVAVRGTVGRQQDLEALRGDRRHESPIRCVAESELAKVRRRWKLTAALYGLAVVLIEAIRHLLEFCSW